MILRATTSPFTKPTWLARTSPFLNTGNISDQMVVFSIAMLVFGEVHDSVEINIRHVHKQFERHVCVFRDVSGFFIPIPMTFKHRFKHDHASKDGLYRKEPVR